MIWLTLEDGATDSINTLRQNKQPESGGTELICQTFGIKKWIYLNSHSPTFAAERAPLPKSNVIAPQYPSVLNVAEMYLLNVEKKSPPAHLRHLHQPV